MKKYRVFANDEHIYMLEDIDNKKNTYIDMKAMKVFSELLSNELNGQIILNTSEDEQDKYFENDDFEIIFKDYEKIMEVAKEIKNNDKKKKLFIGEITTAALIAAGLLASVLASSKVKGMEATAFEDIAEPIRLEQEATKEVELEDTTAILANELKEVEPVQAVEDDYFVSSEVIETKENNTIYINADSNYDEDLETNVSRLDDIIDPIAERWGVSNQLLRDIMKQESHGGTLDNKMQIIFSQWKGQIIKVYNFETQQYETMVLTDTPGKYPNVTYVITKDQLTATPENNINAGAIILSYLYKRCDHNLIEAVQMYNFGDGATMEVMNYTAEQMGMTLEEYRNSGTNDEFMQYTAVVRPNYGDPKYAYNVLGMSTPNFNLDDGKTYTMKYVDANGNVVEDNINIRSTYFKEKQM